MIDNRAKISIFAPWQGEEGGGGQDAASPVSSVELPPRRALPTQTRAADGVDPAGARAGASAGSPEQPVLRRSSQ